MCSITSHPHLSPTLGVLSNRNEVPQPSSPPHTNIADEAASTGVDVRYGGAATTVTGLEAGQGSGLSCSLETDLTQAKKVYGAAFTKLINKVKRLEKNDKLSKSRRKLRHVLLDKEGSDLDFLAQEDPSKQGRKIAQIDEDEGITLVHMGVSTASTNFTTTNVPVTTAGAEISTASPKVKTGVFVDDIAAESLVYIRRSAAKTKDKGIGDIRAELKASEELHLINQRKRYFVAQKAEAKRNKPMTQAQQRTYMSNYIKHMGNYKLQQLKRLSFDEIKDLFETTMRRANTFVPMETEIRRGVPELVVDSSQAVVTESIEAGDEVLDRKLFVIVYVIQLNIGSQGGLHYVSSIKSKMGPWFQIAKFNGDLGEYSEFSSVGSAGMGYFSPPGLQFHWAWIRALRVSDLQKLMDLQSLMSNYKLSSPDQDRRECVIDNTRSFTISGVKFLITIPSPL
ncbi:hypothetical protein Tco_1021231 [Tanacetum coccineum]